LVSGIARGFLPHPSPFAEVVGFTRDEKTLITGTQDGDIFLWDTSTLALRRAMELIERRSHCGEPIGFKTQPLAQRREHRGRNCSGLRAQEIAHFDLIGDQTKHWLLPGPIVAAKQERHRRR